MSVHTLLTLRGNEMNKLSLEGDWTQLKGKIRETWGRLTDDDVDIIAGKREQLIGKIKERYGKTADEADREVKKFEGEYLRAD